MEILAAAIVDRSEDTVVGALALVRPEQSEKTGWAARFRALQQAKKGK